MSNPPGDVEPDHGPIHHKIVADRREAALGRQAPPPSAALRDRHVHRGMTFHTARNSLFALFPRLLEKVSTEETPEKKDQQDNHERRADELGQC